jgi:hypothetical protein
LNIARCPFVHFSRKLDQHEKHHTRCRIWALFLTPAHAADFPYHEAYATFGFLMRSAKYCTESQFNEVREGLRVFATPKIRQYTKSNDEETSAWTYEGMVRFDSIMNKGEGCSLAFRLSAKLIAGTLPLETLTFEDLTPTPSAPPSRLSSLLRLTGAGRSPARLSLHRPPRGATWRR